MEAASQQVASVLTAMTAVADATGGDAVDSAKAFEAALSSVTKVFSEAITNGTVDTRQRRSRDVLGRYSCDGGSDEVKAKVETTVDEYYQAQVDAGTITADQKQAAVVKATKSFEAVEATVVTSVKAVTAAIKTAVDAGASLSDAA